MFNLFEDISFETLRKAQDKQLKALERYKNSMPELQYSINVARVNMFFDSMRYLLKEIEDTKKY